MKNLYIPSDTPCVRGQEIINDKWMAWQEHDHTALLRIYRQEAQHLETCGVCNGEISKDAVSQARIDALWPGAQVRE